MDATCAPLWLGSRKKFSSTCNTLSDASNSKVLKRPRYFCSHFDRAAPVTPPSCTCIPADNRCIPKISNRHPTLSSLSESPSPAHTSGIASPSIQTRRETSDQNLHQPASATALTHVHLLFQSP